jgi:hypothetical protein
VLEESVKTTDSRRHIRESRPTEAIVADGQRSNVVKGIDREYSAERSYDGVEEEVSRISRRSDVGYAFD